MGKVIGVILTYNSAKTLEDVYQRIPKSFLDEIIVSDDGSTDKTVEIAKQLGVSVFSHEHRGYGGNIRYGLERALGMGGKYMIEIHGDGQYDPGGIPSALEKMDKGCQLLLGSRFIDKKQTLQDGMPLVRYLANRGLSFFDRLFLGLNISEFHTGFRVYSRDLFKKINLKTGSDDYLFSFEIIVQSRYFGFKICEIPIRCDYKKVHTSENLWKASIYSFQTFYILFLYFLARFGFKTKLFRSNKSSFIYS